MALLPAESRHEFAPIDRSWQATTVYLKPRPDGYEIIPNPTDAEKKQLNKQIEYFAGELGVPPRPTKSFIYYPDGRVRREIDNVVRDGEVIEQFLRRYRSSGELSEYSHWSKGKSVAGFSIDPQTKQVTSYANGNGWIASYDDEAGALSKKWLQGGQTLLEATYRGSRLQQTRLWVESDHLDATPEGESLMLISESEAWNCKKGSSPSVQILDFAVDGTTGKAIPFDAASKKDIRPMPDFMRLGPAEEAEMKAISDEWKIAYQKRKAAFFDRFRKLSKEADKVLADFNIEVPAQ